MPFGAGGAGGAGLGSNSVLIFLNSSNISSSFTNTIPKNILLKVSV
jgi:hypothetical protein